MTKLEHGKGGSPAAPEAAKPNSKYFGVKNTIAMAVGVAAVAALFAKSCGDKGGQDRPAPPPVASVQAVQCPAPVPGNCNLTLGEHDFGSPNWAPAKCGYCGDGVTEGQQWETPQNCPVDFHCGDGVCASGTNAQVYGAVVRSDAGAFSIGTVTITESNDPTSPNYCEADCGTRGVRAPAPARSGGRTDRRGPREDPGPAATATTPGPATTGCPLEVMQRIQPRISSSLMGNPGAARSAAGADSNTVVRARVSVRVSNGSATVTGVSLSCPGGACAGGPYSGTINLAGIPAGSANCSDSVTVNIPPG